jgi:ABC-type sugar transport system ATPase subunit
MQLSVTSNTTLIHLRSLASRTGVLRPAAERSKAWTLLERLSISAPSPSARVTTLSGGNQQKVLFAKWLLLAPHVLVLDEPTRGVDVGARAAIHRLITDLADQGVAILLISSELEEVLGLAHRVLVIRRGAITREFPADPPLADVMEAAFGLAAPQETAA